MQGHEKTKSLFGLGRVEINRKIVVKLNEKKIAVVFFSINKNENFLSWKCSL